MNIKSLQKSILILFTKNFNQNTTKIPCSIEMKSKQQGQICGISKIEYVVFYYKILHLFSLLQNCVSKNEYPFPRISIFVKSPSHHQHDSKQSKNSNFKPSMSNDQSLSLMPCSSKIT